MIENVFRVMECEAKLPIAQIGSHLPALYALARNSPGGTVVECGVGAGASTAALFAGVVDSNGSLTSYDIDEGSGRNALSALRLSAEDPRLGRWRFVVKDSVLAVSEWPDSSVGLWFLDTSHKLEDTRRELIAWLPKMHPAGIMCGHDYHLEKCEDGLFSVKKAVDEFVSVMGDRFTLQVLPYDYGLFILWPKK